VQEYTPQIAVETNVPFPIASELQAPLFDDFDQLGQTVIGSNLQRGFTQVPNDILTCPDISPRAKLAYEALLYHARQKDTCFPGHKRLATLIGCSEDTIQRGLKDLRDYLVRVDAETGKLVVDHSCPACTQAQENEPDPRRKPFWRCEQHTCLVVWVRRGLTRTNIYIIPPIYTTLKQLEGALEAQRGEEIVSAAETTPNTNSTIAVSENRNLRHQETAKSGINHIKKNHIQGNDGYSNSNLEGGSVTIGNDEIHHQYPQAATISQYTYMHEIPMEEERIDPSPPLSNRNRNRISDPQEKETARETAKQVNEVTSDIRLNQHHHQVRAAAAAGIDVKHRQELERQQSNNQPETKMPQRELPDWLQQVMGDFSRELNDSPRTQSNITNLDRVYVHCRDFLGYTDEEFYYLVAEMKRRARYAVVLHRTPEGKPARAKYFFTCLYNEIGYRPAQKI